MVQIGAAKAAFNAPAFVRKTFTGIASASGVQRAFIGLVFGIADFQVAKTREQMAVAGVARGHDAVKHIHALADGEHQILGRAHTHQITRFVRGQLGRNMRQHALHVFFRLADRQTAHGHAGEIHLVQAR